MLDTVDHACRGPSPTLGYAPSTFLERGVWVPFTTPALAGARVRPGPRERLEYIIANPSGSRGVYILQWDGVLAICSPTVHDRVLAVRLQAVAGLTPSAIRLLALDTAREGLAGREAAAAAAIVRDADTELVTLTNFALLMRLVEQLDPDGSGAGEAIETRSKRAVASVAASLGCSADQVAVSLEELARLFAPLGLGLAPGRGRVVRSRKALADLRLKVGQTLHGPPAIVSADADLVLASADLTLSSVARTTADAMGLAGDPRSLLRLWQQASADIAARLARPDWLLDGWERIALLWDEAAGNPDSRFAELADLVPAIPREASIWVEAPIETTAGALRMRRRVRGHEDWRTGATLQDLVARNEQLLVRDAGDRP